MTRVHRPFLLTCALASCLLLIGISSAYAGQVFVHTPANGTVVLDVQPSETIAQVEADIQTRIGVDPSVQILTFAGHALDPIQNLSYYNIGSGNATFYLTIASSPVSVPDPVQQSSISGISPVSGVAQTPTSVVIAGTFVEQISNIAINDTYLRAGSWSQGAHSVTFVAPATVAGSYRIQIFNGSAPVLASHSLVITPAPILASATHKTITYLRCLNSWHLRIAFGVNPTCPVGYINK